VIIAALLVIGATSCARKTAARVPSPRPPRIGAIENGIASWYGVPYDGRPAASGEIYDMHQLTAAHRTLPFGARVEVTDLDNGKHVEVRITDRGPFVDGRVIDISLAAARELDMLRAGTARVKLKVIALPPRDGEISARAPLKENYAVQAGAFSSRERAESLRTSLLDRFDEIRVTGSSPWRVVVGQGMTLDAAVKLAARVRHEVGEALVVRDR
jgi:rare lipoprotein A